MSDSLRRGALGLAFAAALVAGLSPAVHADNLDVDGDVLDATGAVSLGEVCRGDSNAGQVQFDLVRVGVAVNNQTWANSTVVTIAPTTTDHATSAGSLALGSTTATTPSDWTTIGNNETAPSGKASVALAVPVGAPLGETSLEVTYSASGKGAAATTTVRTDKVMFSWTVADCAPSDTSAPEISYVLDPATPDGENGWYVSDVSLDWTVTDAGSDVTVVAGCLDETFAGDGTFSPQCSATSAGGTTEPVTVTVKRDATPPEVVFTEGPAEGASYHYGDPVPGSVCEAGDVTSGVVGGCSVSGGGTTVGAHTLTASAVDEAGNAGSAERTYSILAWRLDGFYKPVTSGSAVVNTVKAGSTVPLKFNVYKGTTAMTADIGAKFTTGKVGCEGGDVEDPVEITTTGSTVLRYDAAGGQWVQNWATPSAGKGSCYRVTMTTADGSRISADFKLK